MKKLFIAAILLGGMAGAATAQAPAKTKTKTAIAKTTVPQVKSVGTETGALKPSTPAKTAGVAGKEKKEAQKPKVDGGKARQKGQATGTGGKKRHKARKKLEKGK